MSTGQTQEIYKVSKQSMEFFKNVSPQYENAYSLPIKLENIYKNSSANNVTGHTYPIFSSRNGIDINFLDIPRFYASQSAKTFMQE